MNRTTLLYIAAALSFLTGLSHLIGTFMPIPLDQVAVQTTIAAMKDTMVPMPVGDSRSYMQILDGNNFGTILFLILCAAQLVVIAKSPSSTATNKVLIVTAISLVGFSIVSILYFFPVPAVFTCIAAVLCFVAYARSREAN